MEQNIEKYVLTNDSHYILQHIQDVEHLLKQTYWANHRDVETIRASIENSLCFAITDKKADRVIAFARAITDFTTVYYLADVIVDEEYRKQGLGKRIVSWITEQEPQLKKPHGVLLTKDAHELYTKYGFKEYTDHCMCKF